MPLEDASAELIPILLVVLMIGLAAMLYALWREQRAEAEDDAAISYDLDQLRPYSGQEWQRHDLP